MKNVRCLYISLVYVLILTGCSRISLGIPKEEVIEKQVLKLETVLTASGIKRIGDQLLFRPDSKELISTVRDRTIFPLYIWDLENKKLKHTIDKREKRIRDYGLFTFSEDSKKLFFSVQLNTKPEFNYETRERIYRHINHFGEIPTDNYDEVIFHRYNEFVGYEQSYSKTIFGTKKFKKKVIKTVLAGSIFFFKDDYFITNSYYNNGKRGLVYFDKNTFKVKDIKEGLQSIINASISPNKNYLAIPIREYFKTAQHHYKEGINIYDIDTLKLIASIPYIYNDVTIGNMTFLDNEHIALEPIIASNNRYKALDKKYYNKKIKNVPIKVINIKTKKEEEYFQEGQRYISFLPINKNYFISYDSRRSTLVVWNRKTKKPVQKLKFGKYAFGMAISSDGKQVALSSDDKIYIYSINNKGVSK